MMNKKEKYNISNSKIRSYLSNNSIIFKKNNESFGELSNMSMGFPLEINNVKIYNTEALYQCFRFPDDSSLQQKIISEKSPMKVKMISNANKKFSRPDWDDIKIKVMKWCLRVKLAQNFVSFGIILDKTKSYDIVENSSKDNFWGAVPNGDGTIYEGQNALGRLLMELRNEYHGASKYHLLYVDAPDIDNFKFLGQEVPKLDSRMKFIKDLENYWSANQISIFD